MESDPSFRQQNPAPPTQVRPRLRQRFSIRQLIRGELLLATLGYLWLAIGEYLATSGLPAGKAYVLTARGSAAVRDALLSVLVIAGFAVFYSLATIGARRWLGIALRAMMFVVFTAGIVLLRGDHYIAAVQADGGFVLLKRWPLSQTTVGFSRLKIYRVRQTGDVASLQMVESNRQYWRTLFMEPVSTRDPATMQVLSELGEALDQAGVPREAAQ